MTRIGRSCVFSLCVFNLLLLVASPGLQAQQIGTQSVTGVLNIVWGDPHQAGSGAGGGAIYTLEALNGARLSPALAGQSRVTLQLAGQENVAAYYFGKRVTVSGRVVPDPSEAAGASASMAMTVDSITPDALQQPQTGASVSGTRKVIYLLLKFSDDAATPHPPVFYTDLINPDTPPVGEVFTATINSFFKKTSWNQFSWIGDVGGAGGLGAPGGWLTLPNPKSFYANCGWNDSCANLAALGDDGTALGRAQGINFANYDNINFVLTNDLDCCAWGGGYFSAVDNKVYGATWEPPWGQETGTYAHEMGHSIGLPHSGWVYYAYDSPWDVMSDRTSAHDVLCGAYFSTNSAASSNVYCSEPGDGYIAAHKDYLGWIPPANVVTTDTLSSVTVPVESDALALNSAIKMIKICIAGSSCTGSSARYFTVEARVGGLGPSSQYDNAIVGNGVIIHDVQFGGAAIGGPCFFNSQSGWAVPIDSTPNDYDSVACDQGDLAYPNYALFNAQWSPGQTYVNNAEHFAISVISRSGSTFTVSVNPIIFRNGFE